MPPLFDGRVRDNNDAMQWGQSHSSYLDRSARTSAGRIRDVLNGMFDRYAAAATDPERAQRELHRRFHGSENSNHASAFWELLIHECLLRLGYQVEVHPSLPGTNDRPDFRATSPEGTSFIIEAVCLLPQHETDQAALRRFGDVYRAINEFKGFPQWRFNLRYSGLPGTQIRTSQLLEELSVFLAEIDQTGIDAADNVGDINPDWQFKQGDWVLELDLWPASAQSSGRIVSYGLRHAYGGNTIERTRYRIDEKAGRYGKTPLIIAANMGDLCVSEEEVMSILYGPSTIRVTRQGVQLGEPYRGTDGVFMRHQKPVNLNLVGVMLSRCNAWDMHKASLAFHRHPSADENQHAVANAIKALDRLPGYFVNASHCIEKRDGITLRGLLNLPEDLPD